VSTITVNWFLYREYFDPAQVGSAVNSSLTVKGFGLSYGYEVGLSYLDPVILSTVDH
jgi:hypothetical protein